MSGMRIVVIGAGPTGLFTGIGLARRGHQLTVVDRDPGPQPDGGWPRRGVMQFHHAHTFRGQVFHSLEREAPDALRRWLEAGAEPVRGTIPPGREVVLAVRSRRTTFERAVREAAAAQPGLALEQGHVDEVTCDEGRANGIRTDSTHLPADLVVDASGRSGRVNQQLRAAPEAGGACGIAYVDRVHRLREGADPGPLHTPAAWTGAFDGYQVLVFLHERGFFSTLILRSADDPVLKQLRHRDAFEAACRAIPVLAAWTDPDRSQPSTEVLAGGQLLNQYRSQRGSDGGLALPGLVFVGDAVCTTTPNFGRGVVTSLTQAEELLDAVDDHDTDVDAVVERFDAWGEQHMRPWVEDHVRMDEAMGRRWHGEDVDLEQPLPSDLVLAAAQADPAIGQETFPYVAMLAGPSSLTDAERRARELYRRGWRPTPPDGPSAAGLRELVTAVTVRR